MMSNFFQDLILYSRRQYISSLKAFKVAVDPKEVTDEMYSTLSDQLKKHLDLSSSIFTKSIENLEKQKSEWVEITESKEPYSEILKEPARDQVRKIDKFLKKDSCEYKKLYLVEFHKRLTVAEARKELQKIGFQSADFLETILFIQKYKESIMQHLPVIALDAYHDWDKQIKTLNTDIYCVCYHSEGFSRIGDTEHSEFYGYSFMESVSFLAKPI